MRARISPMSHISYNRFARDVLSTERRQCDKNVREYLSFVASSFQSRTLPLRKGFPLWRAQIATGARELEPYGKILAPCEKGRMIPDPKKVGNGRANPRGTAYLYLATNEKTAVHEVRPWVGEHVSLGLFETCRSQKIIDCSKLQGKSEAEILLRNVILSENGKCQLQKPSETQLLEKEWISIDNAFSRPISQNECQSRYIPTQQIAAFIREQGYHGIAYKSVFADGFNIMLFDVSSAELRRCSLVEVTDLQVSFEDSGEAYSIIGSQE